MSSTDKGPAAAGGRPRRRGWRRLLPRLLVLVVTFVVIDVVIGLTLCRGGRFVHWNLPPFDLTYTDAEQSELRKQFRLGLIRFDAGLGWTHAPLRRTTNESVNAAAARGPNEYKLAPPRGVTRVAAFGDSFTFAAEVSNEDAWTRQLELQRPYFEVMNFGVNGYGPDQAYLRYKQHGATYKPKIVLLGLMIENLNRVVSVYRPAYSLRSRIPLVKPRFRLDGEGVLELLPTPVASTQELFDQLESGQLLEQLDQTDYWVQRATLGFHGSPLFLSSIARIGYSGVATLERQDAKRFHADPSSEPFELTREIIRVFQREARAAGVERFVVIIFPHKQSLTDIDAGQTPYWTALVDALVADQIEVLDPTPDLAALGADVGVDGIFNHVHYSPAGNKVIADAVLRHLFAE